MDRSEAWDRLVECIFDVLDVEEHGIEEVEPRHDFREDFEIDSLGVVELMLAIEETFGVKIPDEEAEGVKTVADAYELICAKLAI